MRRACIIAWRHAVCNQLLIRHLFCPTALAGVDEQGGRTACLRCAGGLSPVLPEFARACRILEYEPIFAGTATSFFSSLFPFSIFALLFFLPPTVVVVAQIRDRTNSSPLGLVPSIFYTGRIKPCVPSSTRVEFCLSIPSLPALTSCFLCLFF